jgi:hypothetical protein
MWIKPQQGQVHLEWAVDGYAAPGVSGLLDQRNGGQCRGQPERYDDPSPICRDQASTTAERDGASLILKSLSVCAVLSICGST